MAMDRESWSSIPLMQRGKSAGLFTRRRGALIRGISPRPRALPASKGIILLISACLCLLPTPLTAADSPPAAVEDKVKAVYIYNFIRFTEWPEAARSQEINLSILGNLSLLKIFKGEPFKESRHGLKLNVRTCTMPGCIQESHALFIDGSEEAQVKKVLRLLGDRPVLTISDLPGFVELGGMIELRRHKERVIFRINLDAIKRTPLYVSAQLLQLAEIVEREP